MLESIGLNSLDEQVYRALLKFPHHGVTQVADHLQHSEEAVRAALDNLAELSLVCPSQGRSAEFRVVSPEVGLASLLTIAERHMHNQVREVESARATIAMLAAEHRDTRQCEVAVRHEGVDAIVSRIEVLAQDAQHEVLSMNPREGQTPEARAASRTVDEQMLRRGVRIRCLYQESIHNDPALCEYATWLVGQGVAVRTSPVLPLFTIIYDSRTVLLPVDPDNGRDGALELTIPSVTRTMRSLFELTWAAATPHGCRPPAQEDGLTPMERALLQLLLAGVTDAVAARHLGVSLRTVRRIMADLMHRLGARSRFQAGVHAAGAGWLHSPSAIATAPRSWAGEEPRGTSTARQPAAKAPAASEAASSPT